MNKQTIATIGSLAVVLLIGLAIWMLTSSPLSLTKNKMDSQIPGLKIETLTEGTGAGIVTGQTAVVHYTGMFTDGKVFDSSIPRGQTFPVPLGRGQVIKGWDLGLVGMKVGEKRKLTISPELAYGASGIPGVIPENATLVFEVTLESIQ